MLSFGLAVVERDKDSGGKVGLNMPQLYTYQWGNNPKRATMKGRVCEVLGRGKMNSCLVRFVDNGQEEVISRNALRKYNEGDQ